LTRHHREIAVIRKAMQAGMKMQARTDRRIESITGNVESIGVEVCELTSAQRETVRMLKASIGPSRPI